MGGFKTKHFKSTRERPPIALMTCRDLEEKEGRGVKEGASSFEMHLGLGLLIPSHLVTKRNDPLIVIIFVMYSTLGDWEAGGGLEGDWLEGYGRGNQRGGGRGGGERGGEGSIGHSTGNKSIKNHELLKFPEPWAYMYVLYVCMYIP